MKQIADLLIFNANELLTIKGATFIPPMEKNSSE